MLSGREIASVPAFPFLLLALALVSGSVLLYRRSCHLPLMERWLTAGLPAALAFCLGVLLNQSASNVEFTWSPVRLAPAFDLRYGQTLYPKLDEGPVSGHIYGPMAALVYLPATLFATPQAAIRAAGVIAAILFFLPACVFLQQAAQENRQNWRWTVGGGLVFLLLVLASDALRYNAFLIHAEAPALGFAMAAGVVLWRKTEGNGFAWRLPLAAMLAVLAVWSKQTLLPILIALPLYVWLREGRPMALRFGGWLGLALLLTGSVFALWFGAGELWLNEIAIPAKHPWTRSVTDIAPPWITGPDYGRRAAVLLEAGLGLLRRSARALGLLVMLGVLAYTTQPPDTTKNRWRTWLGKPQGLCLWLGLWLVPTSLLGRVKVGGDHNSYGPALCFICLAAAVWLLRTGPQLGAWHPALVPKLNRLVWLMILGANVGTAWLVIHTATNLEPQIPESMDEALRYARKHPGQVYFPWNPLLTLMSEQRAYHFAYGVFDRSLARMPLTPEHFRNGLPKDLQEVIYPVAADRTQLAPYLRDFTIEVRLPELPGWVILRRKEPETTHGPAATRP